MTLIKNFDALNKTPQRKICLELIDAALFSIQPQNIIQKNFSCKDNILTIQDKIIDLNRFERIFLLGFGKGSASLSKEIEKILGNFLTKGRVIDLVNETFSKIEQTIGTHPLPSEENLNFTKKTIQQFSNLTIKDLVLIVISGGGSVLFENPYKINLEKLIEVNKSLLLCGATITEMNIVRKHLSLVKGGGLGKLFYPAKIVSLIASDVPGNDLSTIASGPTVMDKTTREEALTIVQKYKINIATDYFLETPKDEKYFKNISNIILVNNQTALHAMKKKAKELGFDAEIISDKFQAEAKMAGKELIDKTASDQILLAAGETTVKVLNKDGQGGRNQELVLAALPHINENITIVSFDSDGWDNSPFAGAIGDRLTLEKAKELNLDLKEYLRTNNTLPFFEKVGDGIITGRLPSNVSDLMMVLKRQGCLQHRNFKSV